MERHLLKFFLRRSCSLLGNDYAVLANDYARPLLLHFMAASLVLARDQQLGSVLGWHRSKLQQAGITALAPSVSAIEYGVNGRLYCRVLWQSCGGLVGKEAQVGYYLDIGNGRPAIEMIEFDMPLPEDLHARCTGNIA